MWSLWLFDSGITIIITKAHLHHSMHSIMLKIVRPNLCNSYHAGNSTHTYARYVSFGGEKDNTCTPLERSHHSYRKLSPLYYINSNTFLNHVLLTYITNILITKSGLRYNFIQKGAHPEPIAALWCCILM